ncbi:fasciclin domain-containing protein [Pedobacter agri]|uniref:fasciclin domain-containing protein n=1 Tax=Pedobacter agri TaxID=454586 RepID=UPI002788861B|nr:fasciclin domain-containing protein [Pedobacter agri]MDQ1139316.1 putative surface protein with fasciclin (FAS1) repeats [Pedobacter agri]
MSKILPKFLIVILTVIVFLSSCRKKEFDEFYGRPENLGDPIYQQLQAKGNFSRFLECIDKAGYKETLSTAGSWTVFAPTDDAFKTYLQENSLTEISADLASKIVRYSMIYDGEKTEKLSDFFSIKGFIKNTAFRRRSVYYDFVYDEKDNNGNPIKAIATNRNGIYFAGDFNNKSVTYFLAPFMAFSGLTAADYNFFYPNIAYNGANIGSAHILPNQQNIIAENGIIHVIDRVLTPPLSIDQYLTSKPEYSTFKSLLDKFVTYGLNTDISHRYEVLTGKAANVYVKSYSSLLGFSPNNENFLKVDANDAQQGSYSIIAPSNAAVDAYAKAILLKYWRKKGVRTLDELYVVAPDLIRDYINSHLYNTTVWPSKFSITQNVLGDVTKQTTADITDKQVLSNGFFYGSNKSQDASVFSTIYGNVNLDPDYIIMKQALLYFNLTIPLKTQSIRYVIIPIPDVTLKKMGFSYEPFFVSQPIRGDLQALRRILQTHIIPLGNRAIPDFRGGAGILETSNGEYIKYNRGTLLSAGTQDSLVVAKQTIPVDSISTTPINGAAVYGKEALTYTALNVGKHIEKYGTLPSDPYYNFFQFLANNTTLYNRSTGAISGLIDGVSYTVFIPTNAAIVNAVKAGLLPGNITTGVPNFTTTDGASVTLINKFIQYHIINKSTVVSDGQKVGEFETLLKSDSGDASKINVITNTTTTLSLRDVTGATVNVLLGTNDRSNVLSNRTVIHQINSYLKYQF